MTVTFEVVKDGVVIYQKIELDDVERLQDSDLMAEVCNRVYYNLKRRMDETVSADGKTNAGIGGTW